MAAGEGEGVVGRRRRVERSKPAADSATRWALCLFPRIAALLCGAVFYFFGGGWGLGAGRGLVGVWAVRSSPAAAPVGRLG